LSLLILTGNIAGDRVTTAAMQPVMLQQTPSLYFFVN
jgi:hypothetical protein